MLIVDKYGTDTPRDYSTARKKLLPFLEDLDDCLESSHADLAELATGTAGYSSSDSASQAWHLVERMRTVIRRFKRPAATEKRAQVEDLEDVQDALSGLVVVLELAAARMKGMASYAESAWVEVDAGPRGSFHGFIPPAYKDAFEKMFPLGDEESETDAKGETEPEMTTPPVASAPSSTPPPSKPRAPSNGRKPVGAAT